MRFLLFLMALFSSAVMAEKQCDRTVYNKDYNKKNEVSFSEEKRKWGERIYADAEIVCTVGWLNKIHRIEKGYVGRSKYTFNYSWDSGLVEGTEGNTAEFLKDSYLAPNWEVKCDVNRLDDSSTCYMKKDELIVGVDSKGMYFSQVAFERYPRSRYGVKVDNNATFWGKGKVAISDKDTKKLIRQLSSGRRFITRYMKWPQKVVREDEVSVYGFNEALQFLERVHFLYNK